MCERVTAAFDLYAASYDGYVEAAEGAEHNVVTSMLVDSELHAPVIDIDVPHRLVPSTTPGHSHLYIDVPMEWEQFDAILEALADAGVVEEGYYRASMARGFSTVRLPHVKKEPK